jgi:translation initiation factor 2B subunit (eIF-2B alpha/beta/delta family)/8-oxo-dGTP pyrophosphatase MutT (NUDIX family)
MRIRHVVSAFLLHKAKPIVLLGRRSDRVGTYPARWAAISGSVETERPLEQAYREIQEETGLDRANVDLVSEGWTVRSVDWELGIVWVVHPYLFACKTPAAVRPDWEHERFEWVDPARIPSLETVPKLAEAYASAAALCGRPDSRWAFRKVQEDREHGAEELGLWTLEGLKRAAEEAVVAAQRGEDALSVMTRACRDAVALRPSMAPVRSAALSVFGICRDLLTGKRAQDPLERVAEEIGRLMRRREAESVAPAQAAAPFIRDGARIITLSYSFTVLSALKESARRVSALVVAESRPTCEGRETARLAASFGIPTELMTDAAAARAIERADVVLFGADALCSDGSVVNKAGTLAFCCAARYFGAETLCLGTDSKILPAGFVPPMEEMAPGELGEPIEGVTARNPYFELVPAELVGRLVTGSGVTPAGRLRSRAEELGELQEELERQR